MASIEQAQKEVDRCVKEMERAVWATDDGTAAQVETHVWAALLALGRALMALFFVRRAEKWLGRSTPYTSNGAVYAVVGTESAEIGTRFGRVQVERPVARRIDDARAPRELPLDRELRLPGGFTFSVVSTVAQLCAHLAFATTRGLLRDLFGWSPSSRAVLRIVDAMGAQARPFLEQAEVPEDDGEVLVITVDGKGAPAISSKEYARRTGPRGSRKANRRHERRRRRKEHPKVRRGPGKKSKNAKMAAVGVLYTLRRDDAGRLDGPINKRVYATFTSYRALFEWLHAEAVRRGYGTSKFKRVLFIADGAELLWSMQQEFFPDADVCLDWYHVVEKLWKAGKAMFRGTRTERRGLEAWVAEQKRRLRKGLIADVIHEVEVALTATAVTGPGNKYRRKVLGDVLGYLTGNVSRLEYARLRRADLDISSGVVEGAVRHLVGVRLDGPGMRWGRDRAEAVLHLRCVLINGLWADFERFIEPRSIRLAPQPIPARTHDAVVKKAA